MIRFRMRDERGANMVEMAIVSLLLLLLIAGVLDIGRAFNNYIIVTNAAREGARYGARLPCKSDNKTAFEAAIVQAVVNEADDSGLTLDASNVTIDPDPTDVGCAAAGSPLEVTVEHDFATIMGGVLGFDTITMRSRTEMLFFGVD